MCVGLTEIGGILSAIGGLGAAVATGFAANYGRKTWKVYEQQERHMATANEIQRSLAALATRSASAERRARESEFAPNLLLKNPRGVHVDFGPEGTEPAFGLHVEWEVHNLGRGPAQEVAAAAATSLWASPREESFVKLESLAARPLMPGESCWARVNLGAEFNQAWGDLTHESPFALGPDPFEFKLEALKRLSHLRPAIVVTCWDVFGSSSRFAADLEGNMRLVGTPFGGDL